ncbi:MAG TPA: HAMP domain-containing histidine kinase, partial [Nitratifractor sp.]|nr:HAMP domain-containing histidine kinase [Nitratifractor sp.]
EERVDFFSSIAMGNHLQLHRKIDENLQLNINPTDLQRLIDNNLSNAMKYSKPYSVVTVRACLEDTIVLEFLTKSKPIKSQEALFEPHYQEELNKGGFGLGLSLVKEICQKYGYTIELLHSDGYNIFRYKLEEYNA